jgi:hypothetical protein
MSAKAKCQSRPLTVAPIELPDVLPVNMQDPPPPPASVNGNVSVQTVVGLVEPTAI